MLDEPKDAAWLVFRVTGALLWLMVQIGCTVLLATRYLETLSPADHRLVDISNWSLVAGVICLVASAVVAAWLRRRRLWQALYWGGLVLSGAPVLCLLMVD